MGDLSPAFTVDSFDGLRLSEAPILVGEDGALDLLDVDWDGRGVLGSRMGATKLTTKDPASNYTNIFGAGVAFEPLGETYALLARRNELLVKINEAGEETGGTLATAGGRVNFTQMGVGTLTPITYIAIQNSPVRKFDGTNFSEPTATVDGAAGKAMPKGHFVANWQDGGNRLVVANTTLTGGPNGAPGSPSHVFFSEPGNAEAYESTAYVQLNPGDGEQIVGIAVWGRQVFVFKETYVFVFYGISADEEGKPIFNFSTVDLGTRALAQRGVGSPNVVAGREGVYFLAEDGVWVTTGGAPTLVTPNLDFSDDRRSDRTELGEMAYPLWKHAKGIAYLEDCLFVGIPEEEGEGEIPVKRVVKIDLTTGRTTYWKTSLNCFTVWSPTWNGSPRLLFSGYGAGHKGVYFFDPSADTDPTVEMNPYYEAGFYDVDDPDEKTLTMMKLWGSGDVDVAIAEDFGPYGDDAKTFSLGAGEAIAQAQHQRGQNATVLSHRFSGAGPWSIQRVTRYLQDTRVAATEKKA